MVGKTLVVLAMVAIALLLFGKGLELALQYWLVAVIALALWFIWRVRQDKKGAWTNKSPERFSKDYREVRSRRTK